MADKERLYEAFGEIIYAVAMADGLVMESELQALYRLLKGHPWASQIQWSFDYEEKKHNSLKDTFSKALQTFKEYGPCKDYEYLYELLEEIAKADNHYERKEGQLITNFKKTLQAHFANADTDTTD